MSEKLTIEPAERRTQRKANKAEDGMDASIDRAAVDRTIAEMAQKITEARTVSEAQKTQLGVVDSFLKPRSCFIAHYDSQRNLLNIEAVRGRNDSRIHAVHPNEGAVGRCFSSGIVVREDSLIAVPLQGKQAMLGVLVIISPRHELTDELLQALAAQVAAAADVARQRDDSTKKNRELESAVAGLKVEERKREELLSNISHDLKNPLTTIKTYLAMMRREAYGALTEKQVKALEVCDRNSDRLLRLINDLLLISRLRGGEMKLNERPFGLRGLSEDVLQQLVHASERARVTVAALKDPETFVRGDRERLSEALFNILETAILMSPANETVTVSLETDAAALAVLTVKVAGEGIRADVLQNLFDTFYRIKSSGQSIEGSGLGLPIAAKIAEMHGGKLDVVSNPGEGATFSLRLPLFAGAVTQLNANRAPANGAILLVEDDADCRDVLEEVLTGEGYPVRSAPTAESAMQALATFRPALVLLDLRLADGDGRSILHHIRTTPELKDTQVYIVSGASDAAQLTVGLGNDRIDGLFEKPLQLGKLLSTVSALVERDGPRG